MKRREFLKGAALAATGVAAAGTVVGADEKGGGKGLPPVKGKVMWSRTGHGIGGVIVTDGLNCVRTAKDGSYELPGRVGARFVSVTPPSGWSTSLFYLPISRRLPKRDFSLDKYPAGEGKGCTFVQVTDSEISRANAGGMKWIMNVKKVADDEKAAFIVHTGDIAGHGGMVGHMQMMNDLTMERPVRYCVGNHDLVEGSCGEEVFEALFGPCWHSFEVGGVHFCVTPMDYGDVPPKYSMDDAGDWLRNDLALVPKDMPVVILGHMLCNYHSGKTAGVVYGQKRKFDIRTLCNYRGFVYGHLHDTMFRRLNGVTLICSAPPVAGGIDGSPASVRVIKVDEKGEITATARYGANPYPWASAKSSCLWETQLSGAVMYSTPLVHDGLAYVGTVDDGGHGTAGVCALDAKTGRLVWRHAIENSVKNRVLFACGSVIASDAEGRLVAMDPKTGEERWRYELPFWYTVKNAAPALAPDGRTVVFGLVRSMAAVDAETGKARWVVDNRATDGVPHRFAVDGERIYGVSAWDGIYAFSLADGKEVWKVKDFGGCVCVGADPILVDGSLFVFVNKILREIDPATGKVLRKKDYPFKCNFGVASGPAFATPERFIVGTRDMGCVAISRKTLEVEWNTAFGRGLVSTTTYFGIGENVGNVSPIRLSNGLLCAPSVDGAVHFFEAWGGKESRREACGVPYLAGAVETPWKTVLVADFSGRVRAYVI